MTETDRKRGLDPEADRKRGLLDPEGDRKRGLDPNARDTIGDSIEYIGLVKRPKTPLITAR